MYEPLPSRTEGPVVGFRVESPVTTTDIEQMGDEVRATIDEHGVVSLYVEYRDVPVPELEAIDDDIAFWVEYNDHLDRYAVVGGGSLLEWTVGLGTRLTDVEVEYFDAADRDKAWRWVTRRS